MNSGTVCLQQQQQQQQHLRQLAGLMSVANIIHSIHRASAAAASAACLMSCRQAAADCVGQAVCAAAGAGSFSGGRVEQVWHAAASAAHSSLWHHLVSTAAVAWPMALMLSLIWVALC
jgi:hypothetical protein